MKSNATFYCGENEEGDDGVVQAAGRLGDAGQDGERVQQVTEREGETLNSVMTELHEHVSDPNDH